MWILLRFYLSRSAIGLTAAPAAYFSYDGGMSDGANDFLYDTTANGNDYADFLANCPAGPLGIQDAQGCPGNEAGRRILNDGGAELNILNAVGLKCRPLPSLAPLRCLAAVLLFSA